MSVSEQIKKEMKSQNINAVVLAKKMGCSYQFVYDLLKGRRRWNETTISKACEVLKLEFSFNKNLQAEELPPTGTES